MIPSCSYSTAAAVAAVAVAAAASSSFRPAFIPTQVFRVLFIFGANPDDSEPMSELLLLARAGICLAMLLLVFWVAPLLNRFTRLPLITIYLTGGLLTQLLFRMPVLRLLIPAHNAALGVITIAAGSELVLTSLRQNAKVIFAVTSGMTLCALTLMCAVAALDMPELTGHSSMRERIALGLLAGVIAIARSPSSAIAIVSEMRADGPFTQTVLGVTMVTDVVVVVLFSVCIEIVEMLIYPEIAKPSEESIGPDAAIFARHLGSALVQVLCSVVHGVTLSVGCLLVLRLNSSPGSHQVLLLLLAGYGFAAHALWTDALNGWAPPWLKVEPMLSCIVAGFLVCNAYGRRPELSALLDSMMPPVLAFFFFTTGVSMRLGAILRTWPLTLGLFVLRLLSLWLGCTVGSALSGATLVHRHYGWLAYVTQAGMSLGLAGEISERFPKWGKPLETALISVIVLNQLVGPPLLEYALRCSAEDGLACKAQREGRSDAAAHVDAELQPVVDREGSDVSVASEGK